jgi:hypothetical protein
MTVSGCSGGHHSQDGTILGSRVKSVFAAESISLIEIVKHAGFRAFSGFAPFPKELVRVEVLADPSAAEAESADASLNGHTVHPMRVRNVLIWIDRRVANHTALARLTAALRALREKPIIRNRG